MEMSWMNLSLRGARLVDEGWRSIRDEDEEGEEND
jgi:hypothetical protein